MRCDPGGILPDNSKAAGGEGSSTMTAPEIDHRFVAAIADVLGDTDKGLKGSEINKALRALNIRNEAPSDNKKTQLQESLQARLREPAGPEAVRNFVEWAMSPAHFWKAPERFSILRISLNKALLPLGWEVDESGKLQPARPARTIEEAHRRAADLRHALEGRQVHPNIIEYCREELVQDNYFHAVFEAVKGLFERLRTITGLQKDGWKLVDEALCGDAPALKINAFTTETEKSEQRGFASLLRGIYGMFRNPLAHEPKVTWEITKEDALDLLSLLSLVHRRLDRAVEFRSAEAPRSGPTTTDDGR